MDSIASFMNSEHSFSSSVESRYDCHTNLIGKVVLHYALVDDDHTEVIRTGTSNLHTTRETPTKTARGEMEKCKR